MDDVLVPPTYDFFLSYTGKDQTWAERAAEMDRRHPRSAPNLTGQLPAEVEKNPPDHPRRLHQAGAKATRRQRKKAQLPPRRVDPIRNHPENLNHRQKRESNLLVKLPETRSITEV